MAGNGEVPQVGVMRGLEDQWPNGTPVEAKSGGHGMVVYRAVGENWIDFIDRVGKLAGLLGRVIRFGDDSPGASLCAPCLNDGPLDQHWFRSQLAHVVPGTCRRCATVERDGQHVVWSV